VRCTAVTTSDPATASDATEGFRTTAQLTEPMTGTLETLLSLLPSTATGLTNAVITTTPTPTTLSTAAPGTPNTTALPFVGVLQVTNAVASPVSMSTILGAVAVGMVVLVCIAAAVGYIVLLLRVEKRLAAMAAALPFVEARSQRAVPRVIENYAAAPNASSHYADPNVLRGGDGEMDELTSAR
jgi:hypothetical protein